MPCLDQECMFWEKVWMEFVVHICHCSSNVGAFWMTSSEPKRKFTFSTVIAMMTSVDTFPSSRNCSSGKTSLMRMLRHITLQGPFTRRSHGLCQGCHAASPARKRQACDLYARARLCRYALPSTSNSTSYSSKTSQLTLGLSVTPKAAAVGRHCNEQQKRLVSPADPRTEGWPLLSKRGAFWVIALCKSLACMTMPWLTISALFTVSPRLLRSSSLMELPW